MVGDTTSHQVGKACFGMASSGCPGLTQVPCLGGERLGGVGRVLHRKAAESEASWSGVSMLGESNHRNACYFRVI